MISTRVIFDLAQRGQQLVRYDPPQWIKVDPRACNYLMDQSADNMYRAVTSLYSI